MPTVCKICGKEKDLRCDVCFDCAEAESIIGHGEDMFDKCLVKEKGETEAMARLRFLISKGWSKK